MAGESAAGPASVTTRLSLPARAWNLLCRAARVELRIYESLWRAIAHRPRIAEHARGFRYHRPVLTVFIIFIVLSAVEIPIVDAIVHRWPPIRISFLIIGIWGLTWMIGVLCAYLTRPHTVGSEGIRVREGLELDIPVSWDDLASIRMHTTSSDPNDPKNKPKRVFEEDGERICAIRIGNETNLEIAFERPTILRLPGLPPKGGPHEVTMLRFLADDPQGVLDDARRQLDGAASSSER